MFYVFGDYGYENEEELFRAETEAEAENFAREYVADGDFDGFQKIEVAYFAEDGEYVDTWTEFNPEDDLVF